MDYDQTQISASYRQSDRGNRLVLCPSGTSVVTGLDSVAGRGEGVTL